MHQTIAGAAPGNSSRTRRELKTMPFNASAQLNCLLMAAQCVPNLSIHFLLGWCWFNWCLLACSIHVSAVNQFVWPSFSELSTTFQATQQPVMKAYLIAAAVLLALTGS